jgi:hypothetical protein
VEDFPVIWEVETFPVVWEVETFPVVWEVEPHLEVETRGIFLIERNAV